MTITPADADRSRGSLSADPAPFIAGHFVDFARLMFPEDGPPVPGCFRTITREAHPLGNFACFGASVDASTAAEQAEPLCRGAFPSAVLLLGGDVEAQGETVARLGFVRVESMPLMSVTPDRLAATGLPAGYRFIEVDPDEDERWCGAFAAGYGLPLPLAELVRPSRAARAGARGTARCFAAERDGEVVATSMLFLHDGVAGVYAVATVPEHRGRGLGAHLTAEPVRRSWSEGCSAAILQASEMGEPVYRRIGFVSHGHIALHVRTPTC